MAEGVNHLGFAAMRRMAGNWQGSFVKPIFGCEVFKMTAREAAENILKGMLEMADYYAEYRCECELNCVLDLAAGLKCAIDDGEYGE